MLNPTHLLTRAELDAVLAVCPERVRLALEILYLTGQRPQELRLSIVGDMQAGGRLRSPNLKRKRGNGKDRSRRAQAGLSRADVTAWRWIPLGGVPRAVQLWNALAGSRDASAPLLPGRGSTDNPVSRSYLTHRWERAWKAAGLRPGEAAPPLYCLRHTRATLLVEAGTKPPAACAIMGWASIQMAMTYYEASPRILEEALARSSALGF